MTGNLCPQSLARCLGLFTKSADFWSRGRKTEVQIGMYSDGEEKGVAFDGFISSRDQLNKNVRNWEHL